MRRLEDTDPVPQVLAHLRQDGHVADLLGGGHIGGVRAAPWPCLVVAAASDNAGGGRGGPVTRGVSFTLYDSFEEAFGPWAARRVLLAVVQSVVAMVDADTPQDPTHPIFCGVLADGQLYDMRATSGQMRYLTEVQFTMAPSEQPPAP